MKAEKILLSFVAVLIGLGAAGAAFYFYQMTRTLPAQKAKPLIVEVKAPTPTPTPDLSNFLNVDNPKDEAVFSKKLVTISGKTAKDATLIVTTENGDDVVQPSSSGDFTLTETIPDGTSSLRISAIFANGEEKTITRTVTFSTESF